MNFINLHFNSEYSLLSSAISIEKYIKNAIDNKYEYLFISEHNNLFSLAEFKIKCEENNIKPLFGLDLDINLNNKIFRLILVAKNFIGLQKIIKLSTKKMCKNDIFLEEVIDDDFLIIDHPTKGYFSIFNEKIPKKEIYYQSNDFNDPRSILINEQIIFSEKDNEILEILYEINNEKYKKFNVKVANNYSENEKMVIKTNNIAKNCYFTFPKNFNNFKLPKFENNLGITSFEYLKLIIKENVDTIYYKKFDNKDEAIERIKFELSIIEKLEIADYFLVIYDFIKFGKESGIAIGPGRGSASSSIISYILGITEINPLEYNLLFERFLNLERISMPDIDIDIQDNRRDEIIEYIKQKYGVEHVSFINTFQRLSAKSALKDVAKIKGIKFSEINEITKLIPNDLNLEETFQKNAVFRAKITSKEIYKTIFDIAKKIENFPRQRGTHAAGILIGNQKLENIIPLCQEDGNLISQFSMNHLESWGLLKIDLLGLRTLTIIQDIVSEIKKEEKYFDLKKINLNDEITNALLSEGDTTGIFQLESNGMMNTLKKVKVNKFLDLVDIISLYRPGPIKNIPLYIENKNNTNKIEKIDPIYDQIVKETYGIIIYQEQIMQIAQSFSKMNYSEADILRKAISKKNKEEIDNLKNLFINLSIKNNHSELVATKIYEIIEKFAQYGFNKAHAVSYAILAYQMAFLKSRFPKLFYCSILSTLPDKETINLYVAELKKYGFIVEGPSINDSQEKIYYNGQKIIMPFLLIKGLGIIATRKIIEERNKGRFTSFYNFISRAKKNNIGDANIKMLIESNALREFGNIETLKENLESAYKYYENINFIDKNTNEIILDFNITKELELKNIDYNLKNEIELEKKMLGNIYSAFPSLKYENEYKFINLKINVEYIVYAYINNVKEIKDKAGELMGVLDVFDSSKNEILYIFHRQWNDYKKLKEGQIIKINLIKKYNQFRNQYNFIINKIEVINE
ncbi:MAG: DNA polymerase III subunit alpha [Metamycoplasmataceae bacterium]